MAFSYSVEVNGNANETGKISISVTLRSIRITIVAMEKQ